MLQVPPFIVDPNSERQSPKGVYLREIIVYKKRFGGTPSPMFFQTLI